MKVLIIGGAGFIGANAASRFIKKGDDVTVFDNLSRRGTKWNLEYLKKEGLKSFVKGDVRKFQDLKNLFKKNKNFDAVIHLAAQVAVTTSVTDPREDFEINGLGKIGRAHV